MAHPYRPTPSVRERPPVEPRSDRACLVVFLICWLTSVMRFAYALGHDELLGFEPALAAAISVLAPLAAARPWLASLRAFVHALAAAALGAARRSRRAFTRAIAPARELRGGT